MMIRNAIPMCLCALLLGLRLAASDPKEPIPTAHDTMDIEGWQVHVDKRLLDEKEPELGKRAKRFLANSLYSIKSVMNEEKVKRLQQVPIWLDKTHGSLKAMQYHPGADWLKKNGFSAELAKCVHIPDAEYFVAAREQRQQPWAVLHELSHAYHDQVLSFENAEVKAAWKHFVDCEKYKSILHISGRNVKHYGLTNQMEFFAEMSEAYFGANDFFPFNAAELKREEPELFDLLKKIWGQLP